MLWHAQATGCVLGFWSTLLEHGQGLLLAMPAAKRGHLPRGPLAPSPRPAPCLAPAYAQLSITYVGNPTCTCTCAAGLQVGAIFISATGWTQWVGRPHSYGLHIREPGHQHLPAREYSAPLDCHRHASLHSQLMWHPSQLTWQLMWHLSQLMWRVSVCEDYIVCCEPSLDCVNVAPDI